MNIGAFYVGINGGLMFSWQWRNSITWRWIFHIHTHDEVKLGFYHFRTYGMEGVMCGLNTPLLDFSFQSQPNMWKSQVTGRQ